MNIQKTFEQFLMEKHAEEHIGTKETLINGFDDWLCDLEVDDIIDYADIVLNKQKQETIKIIENRMCLLANISNISEIKINTLPFDIRITILELNKILEAIKK